MQQDSSNNELRNPVVVTSAQTSGGLSMVMPLSPGSLLETRTDMQDGVGRMGVTTHTSDVPMHYSKQPANQLE